LRGARQGQAGRATDREDGVAGRTDREGRPRLRMSRPAAETPAVRRSGRQTADPSAGPRDAPSSRLPGPADRENRTAAAERGGPRTARAGVPADDPTPGDELEEFLAGKASPA